MLKNFLLLLLAALGPAALATKTFVYCAEGSPSTFNPQYGTDSVTFNNTLLIFDQLFNFKRVDTTLTPGLAESWEISPDGTRYTIHIKRDVKFHKTATFTPSRNLNADDVIFSIDRQRLLTHPFHKAGSGNYEYFDSLGLRDLIKDVKKIDPFTVLIELRHAEAPFLADLAIPFMSIESQEYANQIQKTGKLETFDLEPVGTGPYIFVRYDKDQTVRYKANPNYFRGKPKIDNLVFSITPEANVRFQKLKTGECHLIAEPGLADLPSIKADPRLKVVAETSLNIGYLAINTKKKPFDNLLVRRALNHALNRQSYLEAVYMGQAALNNSAMPILQWGYNSKLAGYDYNPNKAKELLKKAGLAQGFTVDLWTLPVARAYNPNGRRMGEMMQADLAKVGVKVNLVSFDWPTYMAKVQAGEHTLAQMGWSSDNGDPDNFLYQLLSCDAVRGGGNRAYWCNRKYDKLVRKAKMISEQSQRSKLYREAQTIFSEEAPWVPLVSSLQNRALSKRVVGYVQDVLGYDYFDKLDLEP